MRPIYESISIPVRINTGTSSQDAASIKEEYRNLIRRYRAKNKDARDFTSAVGVVVFTCFESCKHVDEIGEHIGFPDVDNTIKVMVDALQGVVFKNDKLVCEVFAKKIPSFMDKIDVWIYNPIFRSDVFGAIQKYISRNKLKAVKKWEERERVLKIVESELRDDAGIYDKVLCSTCARAKRRMWRGEYKYECKNYHAVEMIHTVDGIRELAW